MFLHENSVGTGVITELLISGNMTPLLIHMKLLPCGYGIYVANGLDPILDPNLL